MTPTAVEKAQELAAACMDSDYQDCSLGKKPKAVVAEAVVEDTVPEYTAENKATIKASFRGQSLLKRKQIQFALSKLNYYSSSVDGIWGKRTEQALVSFGQAEKLSPSDTQGIFKSILSKVYVPSAFAVARKKTCADDVRICDTSVVCQQAVAGNNWETRSQYMPYVTEAKRRGLTCGLGQVTASADEPKKWGKTKKLIGLGIAIVGAIAADNAGHLDSYADGLLGGSSSSSNSYRAPTPTYTAPPQQQPWVQPKSSVNYNRIGNTVLGSDGSSCNKIGPSWICN
jgi:peptidoglycan hydrolase-like protein with peptidoglycan-binding domain